MRDIKVLPLENIRFVKSISISTEIAGIPHFAKVMYARPMTSEYKMKETPDDKPSYFGYLEENYPTDAVDELILFAVRNLYPNAKVKTSHLFFNVDEEKYERIYKNYHLGKFYIQVNPGVKDIYEALKLGKTSWPVFSTAIDFICFLHEKEEFANTYSIIEYNIDKEDEFKSLWDALLKSIVPVI